MSEIHGLAVHAAGAHLLAYKYDPGALQANEVEVKISHCGVCHSDVYLIDNDWGISKYPFIPGHEIVGTVVGVGSGVKDRAMGERVGIGWQADSCGICEWCRQGQEQLCAKAQPTCVGRNGGFADRVRVNSRFAIPLPAALESENAAPLLCGGITVYAPLRNYEVRPSSRVGVIGIGGLGHLGVQFAKAFGAEVTAFSTSKDKEAEAKELGAHHFVNTRDTGALKKVAGSFDLLLSTVGADQEWQAYVNALRPKGTLCIVGAPPSPMPILGVADYAPEGCCGEQYRESAGDQRDAGRCGSAWGEGDYGAVCDGQSK
ncbi:NAD(P)-dependent alcohol dehydrogenase [Tunturiibacter empetritectus]|uniref:NAD(P)-dependent alcohol dehydrogenase n=1 Tax=Tunturiibacter empetritectus TaxID=3069691 RepID=UPI003D9BBC1B